MHYALVFVQNSCINFHDDRGKARMYKIDGQTIEDRRKQTQDIPDFDHSLVIGIFYESEESERSILTSLLTS
jgi:hypothetical protein